MMNGELFNSNNRFEGDDKPKVLRREPEYPKGDATSWYKIALSTSDQAAEVYKDQLRDQGMTDQKEIDRLAAQHRISVLQNMVQEFEAGRHPQNEVGGGENTENLQDEAAGGENFENPHSEFTEAEDTGKEKQEVEFVSGNVDSETGEFEEQSSTTIDAYVNDGEMPEGYVHMELSTDEGVVAESDGDINDEMELTADNPTGGEVRGTIEIEVENTSLEKGQVEQSVIHEEVSENDSNDYIVRKVGVAESSETILENADDEEIEILDVNEQDTEDPEQNLENVGDFQQRFEACGVKEVELDGVLDEYKELMAKDVEEMCESYPELRGYITKITATDLRPGCFACAGPRIGENGYYTEIMINKDEYSKEGLKKRIEHMERPNWLGQTWFAGHGQDAIFKHEMGHILHLKRLADSRNMELGDKDVDRYSDLTDAYKRNEYVTEICSESMQELGISSLDLAKNLSSYGASDFGECFAEAISEVETSDNPRELAKRIYEKYQEGKI